LGLEKNGDPLVWAKTSRQAGRQADRQADKGGTGRQSVVKIGSGINALGVVKMCGKIPRVLNGRA
jgi:hypothetical protein